MPARYWLPLHGLRGPVPVEHLHAALSSWFDHVIAEDRHTAPTTSRDPHDFVEKPYSISPTTRRGSAWGVEVAVMGDRTEQALVTNAEVGTSLRLGAQIVDTGAAWRLASCSWQELRDYDNSTGWTVQFLTPFTSRSNNRSSPFPMPATLLRAPATVWNAYCALGPVDMSPSDHSTIWVSRINARTELYTLTGRKYPGLMGEVTYRCTDPAVAPNVSALLRLAQFSGVGSFRGKGMGTISIRRF